MMKKLLFLVLGILIMCGSVYAVCNNPDFCDLDYPDRDCSQDPTDYIIYNNTVGMGFPGYGTYVISSVPDDLGHSFYVLKNTGMTLTLVNLMTGVGPSDAPFIGLWKDASNVHSRNFGLTPDALVYNNDSTDTGSYTWEFDTRYNFTAYYNWVEDEYNLSFNNGAENVTELGIFNHQLTPNQIRLTECWDDDICYIDGFYMWNGTEGCPIAEEDTTPPSITLPDLSDETPNEGDSISWTCNATDEKELGSGRCSWNDSGSWVNFSYQELNDKDDVVECTNTVTALKGSTVGVKCYVEDAAGNQNQSEKDFTVANAVPVVTLVSPSSEDPYRAVSFNYTYSVSDADGIEDVEYCKLWKDNGTGFFVFNTNTEVSATNKVEETVKDNDTSTINWTVKCYDNDSTEGLSDYWLVHIDSKYPIPHFYYPKGDSSTNRSHSNNTFKLDVDVENDHLRFVYLEINNSNGVQVHSNDSSEISDDPGEEHYNMSYSFYNSSWSLGTYTVYVNATDWADNEREWTITFEVVNTPPTAPTSVVFTSPAKAYSDSLLVCNASGSKDADSDNIIYYYKFKDTDNSTVLQMYSTDNTFDCDTSGCDRGDTIYCHALASDILSNSSEGPQPSIFINNYVPTHSTPLLTSSSETNYTNENLTCHHQSTYDADGDFIVNIFVWIRDNLPFNSLYLPFETNFDDYSGNSNSVSNNGAEISEGRLGNGSYFDGSDYLLVNDYGSILDFSTDKSWELWFKRTTTGTETIFDKSDGNATNYKLEFDSNNKLKFSYSIPGGEAGDYSWETSSEAEFNEGNYSNTEWSTDHVELSASQSSGTYTSKVFNATELASWNTIDWTETLPYGEELPDNKGSDAGADMSNNILLLHMNNNWNDVSGEGNDGTGNGGVSFTTSSKFGSHTGNFDGTDDYVSTLTTNFPTGNENITIEAWFKIDDLNSDNNIVTYGNNAGHQAIQLFHRTSDDKLMVHYWGGYGAASTSLSDTNWHHAAAVHANNNNYLYLDGDLVGTTAYTTANIVNSFNNIGKVPGFPSYDFDGLIDEVAIFDRALSSDEILDHYKRGALRLNLSVRSCGIADCSDESFVDAADTTPLDLSVSNNKFFQYKFDFSTEDVSYSPELSNVEVNYTLFNGDVEEVNLTSTSTVINDTWHHTVVTFDDSGISNFNIYLDGNLDANKTESNLPQYQNNDLYIGKNFANTSHFNGNLDEFRIYNHVLSSEQISNNFGLGYDTIVSEETTKGESYVCNITPTDGFSDGDSNASDALVIKNSPPSAFDLLFPADASILGALPEFNWTESTDSDGDTVSYILQISTDSNFAFLNYNKTLSEEKDENVVLTSDEIHKYYWRVNATDGIDTTTSDSTLTFNYSQWEIEFNVTSGEFDQVELNNINISSCTYSGFDQLSDTTNMYGPYAFPNGTWECTFKYSGFYPKTETFTADNDKVVNIIMQKKGDLTDQEHTWLEALYNCIILKDCDLYDLLLTINESAGNTWQHVKPTDESVITSETEISNTLNSSQNITYDYTINIPVKAGYGMGDYLPIRIGFWFMNESNESCYSQGTLPTGVTVIEPYCNPLMVQTIGPMGGSVDFTVDLRPNLATGTYNVKRIIEIDPNEIWEGYGQEVIDTIIVTEDMTDDGVVDLEKTSESMPETSSGSSSSSGGSSGGSGISSSLNSNSKVSDNPTIVQNTYLNQTVININNTYITGDSNEEETKLESNNLNSITGAVTKVLKNISNNKSISVIIATLLAIILSLVGYIKKYGKR